MIEVLRIETQEQLERVVAAGCELGQGFHIARPLDAGDAEHLLQVGTSFRC
jgi:EAL domain-containing protein (putative c-di-GMP-specific phosphodiesterase class I)